MVLNKFAGSRRRPREPLVCTTFVVLNFSEAVQSPFFVIDFLKKCSSTGRTIPRSQSARDSICEKTACILRKDNGDCFISPSLVSRLVSTKLSPPSGILVPHLAVEVVGGVLAPEADSSTSRLAAISRLQFRRRLLRARVVGDLEAVGELRGIIGIRPDDAREKLQLTP